MNAVEEMEAVFKSGEPLSHICDTVWRGRLMGAGGRGERSLQWERISDVQGTEHRATVEPLSISASGQRLRSA